MEGYEGVAFVRGGASPLDPPVCQGRTPETRLGCAGWMGEGGCFIILNSAALQSLENVVDERLLGGDG